MRELSGTRKPPRIFKDSALRRDPASKQASQTNMV